VRRTLPRPGRRQARAPGESATLARLLAPARARYPLRGATITRPGTVLRHEIPIRTFTEWTDARPGFLEVDLVAHGGASTKGFYLCPLCAVDIATAWVELEPVWGKGQIRVGGAVDHVRTRLPMPLVGLDRDNGSEFINRSLRDYCRRHAITFTRSRPWKKNDSAHVEQKNGAVGRQLIGDDRFASRAAYGALTRVYRLARLHVNFFQPVEKLVTKTRQGARTTAPRRPTRASAPPASSRPRPTASSRRSTSRSTRSTSGAPSSASWTGSGLSPRPIPGAPEGIPR
jgi:hypothetical protein